MQKRNKNIKSQLFKVGFFFLIVGIIIFISTPLSKLRGEVFEEMRLAIFQLNINKNNNNTTINNINTENLEVTPENNQIAEENDKKANYSYIGELSIPKNRVPPAVFAKALTLLSQLFGFFTSSASLKSQIVASAINVLIISLL